MDQGGIPSSDTWWMISILQPLSSDTWWMISILRAQPLLVAIPGGSACSLERAGGTPLSVTLWDFLVFVSFADIFGKSLSLLVNSSR